MSAKRKFRRSGARSSWDDAVAKGVIPTDKGLRLVIQEVDGGDVLHLAWSGKCLGTLSTPDDVEPTLVRLRQVVAPDKMAYYETKIREFFAERAN